MLGHVKDYLEAFSITIELYRESTLSFYLFSLVINQLARHIQEDVS